MADLGYFGILASLVLAVYAGVAAVLGDRLGLDVFVRWARRALFALAALLTLASLLLVRLFVVSDFSVEYVARNSSLATPFLYKATGLWSAMKGSLLFWAGRP